LCENFHGQAVNCLYSLQDDIALDNYRPIYEQHFEQVPKLGGGEVDVEVARQHFSSLLQGDAFDAILERVQRGGPTDRLSKEQFLTITHLVSCTLAAAQNSDALWEDPEEPPPTAHKKRHPTVQECLGSRLTVAAEGGRSSSLSEVSEASQHTPIGPMRTRAHSSSKENMGSSANTGPMDGQLQRPSPRKQPSPTRRPAVVLGAREAGSLEPRPPGVADVDVSDFELKLQVGHDRQEIGCILLACLAVTP
jgi:hypothetical protein